MTDSGIPDDDWRLGHAKTYDGATWHRRRYFIWKPNWDHDHCEFCFASFEVPGSKAAQDDDTQTEGWTSEDDTTGSAIPASPTFERGSSGKYACRVREIMPTPNPRKLTD